MHFFIIKRVNDTPKAAVDPGDPMDPLPSVVPSAPRAPPLAGVMQRLIEEHYSCPAGYRRVRSVSSRSFALDPGIQWQGFGIRSSGLGIRG